MRWINPSPVGDQVWGEGLRDLYIERRAAKVAARRQDRAARRAESPTGLLVPLTEAEVNAVALVIPPDAEGGYVVLYIDRSTGALAGQWAKSLLRGLRTSAVVPGRMTRMVALGRRDIEAIWDRQGDIASGL
jgi:hypothetical protein